MGYNSIGPTSRVRRSARSLQAASSLHGRMELNAVRHTMQIQDAPGDNAGKKLRLTRLYQPVLKGHMPFYMAVLDAPISVAVQSWIYVYVNMCSRAFAADCNATRTSTVLRQYWFLPEGKTNSESTSDDEKEAFLFSLFASVLMSMRDGNFNVVFQEKTVSLCRIEKGQFCSNLRQIEVVDSSCDGRDTYCNFLYVSLLGTIQKISNLLLLNTLLRKTVYL